MLIEAKQILALSGFTSPKPVVAADGQGNVVIAAHGFYRKKGRSSDILVWRSANRGASWERPENITQMANKGELNFDPWLETDRRGHFYLVHALFSDGRPLVHRSKDFAMSWSKPLPIPWKTCDRPVLGISPNGKQIVVAAAMAELVSGVSTDPRNGDDPDLPSKMRARIRNYDGVFVSMDHGEHWEKWTSPLGSEHAIPFAVVVSDAGKVAASWIAEHDDSRSVVSVSDDRGRTWTNNTLVKSLQPDRTHRFDGQRFPVLAQDGSGNLHVAYVADVARKLMVRQSGDWENWEEPVCLSSDDAEEVRMTAIDGCGPMVHITWMERRGDIWQAYYRGSRDGGKSWSPPLCLSKRLLLSDGISADGFNIYADDDQSSVRDDGRGRVHAVWCIRGGHVIHAMIDW